MSTKAKPNELNYHTTEFDIFGFFIEYVMADGKLAGTINVEKNDRGCIGYESTQHHVADKDIKFKSRTIKKGMEYRTRIYPLCGKVIKKEQKPEVMQKSTQIKEAPSYEITEDGEIKNIKTGNSVSIKNDSVRLIVDGKRKTFKPSELKKLYFQEPKKPKKNKVDNGGKKDKSFYDKVRKDYDKDPENFNVNKYAKKVGVSYGRIWSIVKLHKANLESLQDA